jgi:hypothetical protein
MFSTGTSRRRNIHDPKIPTDNREARILFHAMELKNDRTGGSLNGKHQPHLAESFDSKRIQEVEITISALQRFLHARDDGVGTQKEVADMVMNWNYMQVQGGIRYFLAGGNQ